MAVVECYIQNYMWNNSLVSTETKFQEVPMSGEPVILEPRVRNEMGKAGSFEFKMERNSPYYNALLQMKTMMRVTLFGNTIFRGRVLTIDKSLYGTRTVHCEGDFAFFMDSHQLATEEDTRPTISVYAYLQQIINQHNSDVEAIKRFTLGEVPGHYSNATASSQRVVIPSEKANQKFGDTSWNYSMDRLEDLLNSFGGYFRTRTVGSTTYLDWYDNYYNASVNTQTIEISKNLIDLSGPTEIENLFTVVIPIGKNEDGKEIFISDYWPIVNGSHAKVNYITVPELATIPLYSDADLNSEYHRKADYQNAIDRFGYIWKPVNFENANTPEKLFSYAKDWMKNNFMSEITQWSVVALDMKFVNSTNQLLLCGDRVNIIHPEVDQTFNGMSVISAEYVLYDPDKNKYTVGIPSQQINAAYGVKNKKEKEGKTSSGGGGGGGGGGGISGRNNKTEDDAEKDLEKLKMQLQQLYTAKTDWGEDILLDNALAYTMYNTDGTEKPKNEAVASTLETLNKLHMTKLLTTPEQRLQKAIELGVKADDPQVLIELTPGEKQKQTWWKAQTGTYMNRTLGLTLQESNVLLYETAGQSMLAAMVDDEGNWTPYAYQQGIYIRPGAEEIRQMAINTRKILNGEKVTNGGNVVTNFFDNLFGGDLSAGGGYVNFDSITKVFGIGEDGELFKTTDISDQISGLTTKGIELLGGLLNTSTTQKNKSGGGTWYEKAFNLISGIFTGSNTENGGTIFNLLSSKANVDGANGTVGLGSGGKLSGGWDVALNKAFTYTANGKTYTVPAHSLAADDVHFTAKYDSLRAKLLVVDSLLADYAQIETLVAMKADIDTVKANYIKASQIDTDFLSSRIAQIPTLRGIAASFSGNVSCAGLMALDCYIGDSKNVSVKTGINGIRVSGPTNNVYKIQYRTLGNSSWQDAVGTFSRAVSSWTVSGGSGKVNVKANPQDQTKSVNLSVTCPGVGGKITSNGTYTFYAQYQTDGGSYASTGAQKAVEVAIPATSDRYNEGYNQALADAGVPNGGYVYTAAGWANVLYQYPDSMHVVPVYNCATGASSHKLTKK